ncbi:MAG: response regulator [Syntrophales bacterium LBB04]|nr:response regulator [Syntrophales bacterium LBB04]
MSDNLDVIILDDEPLICSVITDILKSFYAWGEVHSFTDFDKALTYCKEKKVGVAIFILDVFLGHESAFSFLDEITGKFAWAPEDTIIITGNASDDIVNMCIASNITYLIEKPIKTYTLKLAVMAIVSKYLRFAKRILEDPAFAESVAKV